MNAAPEPEAGTASMYMTLYRRVLYGLYGILGVS